MKITLYILNHNYGRYINDAITSVLKQTVLPDEILIIDDGSTDQSKIHIEAYRNQPNIRIVYQENKGMMASSNEALHMAEGDYLMRLDADDTLKPEAIETLKRYAAKYPQADWIFPGFYYSDTKGQITGKEHRGATPFFMHSDEQPPHGACSLIKRTTLLNVGGYATHVNCRDGLDLFLKLRHKNTILSVPEYLFSYRRHDKNLTLNKKRIQEAETVLMKE